MRITIEEVAKKAEELQQLITAYNAQFSIGSDKRLIAAGGGCNGMPSILVSALTIDDPSNGEKTDHYFAGKCRVQSLNYPEAKK